MSSLPKPKNWTSGIDTCSYRYLQCSMQMFCIQHHLETYYFL
jgi:hypothetical protein